LHIIDLQQSLAMLSPAHALALDSVSQCGTVLFVGTQKQAPATVSAEALRCGMPFINERWLGGTLTNWRTIRQRIDQLEDLEQKLQRGDFTRLTKKEALEKQRLTIKLQHRLGGLRSMKRLPDLVFITDTRREALAVTEANKLKIPIIALVDTNCDPDPIDLIIPANDDAIRAIKLIVGKVADAVIEGQQLRATLEAEAAEEGKVAAAAREGELQATEDERYLAPGLLAKLRAGKFAGEGEEDEFAGYQYSADEEASIPPAEAPAPSAEAPAASEEVPAV